MKEPRISIIAAIGMPGRIIGRADGSLPWYLPEDLKHFKELTLGHPVIMGRKTWEDIAKRTNGMGLPRRINVVISKNLDITTLNNPTKIFWARDISGAIDLAKKIPSIVPDEIFIIGGGEIYRQTIGIADYLYITLIHQKFDGEVTFPNFVDKFEEPEIIDLLEDEKTGIPFKFLEFKRKARKKV